MSLFLFHRDLRLVDHNGLEEANQLGEKILPVFIFTPEQVSSENRLRSTNSIQFMIQSLRELEEEIAKQGGKLVLGYGHTTDVLKKIKILFDYKHIFETEDYTPYAKQRQAELSEFCERENVEYHLVHDSYLLQPGTILNGSGKTFQKFTPFYERARLREIPDPRGATKLPLTRLGGSDSNKANRKGKTKKIRRNSWEVTLDEMERKFVGEKNPELAVKGGRKEGLELLQRLPEAYAKTHNIPSIPTSMLSAHNHFGTVSIREVHAAASKQGQKELIRQLWWRDFYGNIMANFDSLYKVAPYEFQKEEWQRPLPQEKKDWLERWKRGETGVRIVDAGMRQLLRTGWMHNRIRLVVASWLTKDMNIHWRHGERFFAQHLVDYDATQNMMNWIWVASELPFASAPFRKVSAEGTVRDFDPEEKYVREWLE